MRHKKKLEKLNRPTDQRLALLNGLARQLIQHGQVVTTEARAKAVASIVDSLINRAIKGKVSDYRIIYKHFNDRDLIFHLKTNILPNLKRMNSGGYTSVVKMPPRRGDGAFLSVVRINYERSE